MLAPITNKFPGVAIERPTLTPIRVLFPEFISSPLTSPYFHHSSYYLNSGSGEGPPSPRPRRRFHEIERIYTCRHAGCSKAYGALNHLNTHISLKNHGPKRSPREFAALRKALRERELSHRFRYVDPSPYSMLNPSQ